MARASKFSIEVSGVKELRKTLADLADKDLPYLREALAQSAKMLRSAAARRVKGGIAAKLDFIGVKGNAVGIRAVIQAKHPGANAMEFGRHTYGRRGAKRSYPAPRGQMAKPYLGIVRGDAAIAEVRPEVETLLTDAVAHEFERLNG